MRSVYKTIECKFARRPVQLFWLSPKTNEYLHSDKGGHQDEGLGAVGGSLSGVLSSFGIIIVKLANVLAIHSVAGGHGPLSTTRNIMKAFLSITQMR